MWQRTLYAVRSGMSALLRSPVISTVTLICLVVGMILPLLVMCLISGNMRSLRLNSVLNTERTGYVNTEANIVPVEEFLEENPTFQALIPTTTTNETVFKTNKEVYGKCGVIGKSELETLTSPQDPVSSGRFLTAEDAADKGRVCVINSKMLKELGDLNQVITVNNEDFTIIGVSSTNTSGARQMYIPITTAQEMYSNNLGYTYTAVMKEGYTFENDGRKILESLVASQGIIPGKSVKSAEEHYQELRERDSKYFLIVITVGIAVMLYAFISIVSVLRSKLQQEYRNYAIRVQLGARRSDIFAYSFAQSFLMLFIALVVNSIIIVVMGKFLSAIPIFDRFGVQLDVLSISVTAIIGILTITLLTLITIYPIFRLGDKKRGAVRALSLRKSKSTAKDL